MQPMRPHSLRTVSTPTCGGRGSAGAGRAGTGGMSGSWPLPSGLPRGRLEEFDRVAGRVVQHDLGTAGSGDDVAAEGESGGAEPGHLGAEVGDDEMDTVPAAG